MIDIGRISFNDGEWNYQNGLVFSFEEHGRIISFLIDVIGDRKRRVKVTMHPDINHERPHVHIDRHDASFAIDSGELLAGECDRRTCIIVGMWIERHREDLNDLWDIAKRGDDYRPLVERLKYDFKTVIDSVVIWYNGKLSTERNEDGSIAVVGFGDMLVDLPSGFQKSRMTFESRGGEVKYRDK